MSSTAPAVPSAPTIRTARAADLDDVTRVLAEAFAEDPVLAGFVPAGPRHRDRLALLFAALLGSGPLPDGTVDVAVDARGGILGAAVWEAPGGIPAHRTLRQAPTFLRALGLAGALRAAVRLRTLDRARPGLPHWRLAEVGVGAAARGLGVGSALLAHGLARVDADGSAAYLESSTARNRALYLRNGFAELGPLTGLSGSRPVAMWRAARVATPAA
ncbi:GNAT superfamily N-acetyltransferase [Clavibacter michiganensis]|uniref:GNAT family N-acetyltransferase n=1 Tax=Clavibacter michiganensis TaxID=28447 RepID=UPI001AE980F7|nr:GNAT family N-acetyltransferase [Clavibacter michiganensis]MBP2456448.1 GNAT superfamily N-acetyltransferase [Clavibacter michiganensis]MDQ0409018.1 GNAT superfamily N-acetyltransferase [Clavibacter michiganensis]